MKDIIFQYLILVYACVFKKNINLQEGKNKNSKPK
jgi:hypothetical protein